jgi:hypothetical protein
MNKVVQMKEKFIPKATNITRGYARSGHKLIHRMTWEFYNGPVPKGFDIHHIDGNKMNNHISNLECLTHSAHLKLHMTENSEKVHAWLKTPKGRKFLSEKAKKEWENREVKSFTCEQCKKEFQTKHNRHVKFCSDACVMRARNASGVDNIERLCVICLNPFIINRYQKTVTCSKPCRAKHIGNSKRKS